MTLDIKRRLFNYIEANDDGSETAKTLIDELKKELNYADCDVFSVAIDDLERFGNQSALREALGKDADASYTMDDCETIADKLADWVADEFGENLINVIDYEF